MNTFDQAFDEILRIVKLDGKSRSQLVMKVSEEAGELAEAMLCYEGAPGTAYKDGFKKETGHVYEECIDVIICAAAVAFRTMESAGGSPDLLLWHLHKKLVKWERVVTEVAP